MYMAPEIIVGHPYAFGVDFWAAAVTLFHMLTGRVSFCFHIHFTTAGFYDQPPWYADGSQDVKQKVLYDKLEIYEGEMERDAEDLLRKVRSIYFMFFPGVYHPRSQMLRKLPYKRLRSGYGMESHPYFSNM